MKDPKFLQEEWAEKGFSCDLWVDPPGKSWENFVHETDEIVYVAEGMMEFEMEGKRKILRPGDEVFIPAYTNHSARNIGGATARWYYGYRRE